MVSPLSACVLHASALRRPTHEQELCHTLSVSWSWRRSRVEGAVGRRRLLIVLLVALGLAALGLLAGRSRALWFPSTDRREARPALADSFLPKGAPSRFLMPTAIGTPIGEKERPLVAHVAIVDLDRDGLPDVVACVVHENRVVWLRQSPRGTFTEITLGSEVRAPAHSEAVDLDDDGDLDVLVASLGVMFPSNAKIGSVVVLENQGNGRFSNRVLVEGIARVADARAGDLDGDGDLDIAVAASGYDGGEARRV